MLTDTLLSYDVADGARVLPRWLSSRDEVWVRAFQEEMEACAGMSAVIMEERLRDVGVVLAARHGRGAAVARGVWHVERARWRSKIDARVSPTRARAVTFALAAQKERQEALAMASQQLGVAESELSHALFADRPDRRIRIAPAEPIAPAELIGAYNLALAQSLLVRSTGLTIVVREHARRVVGYAKLRGLMATFAEGAEAELRARIDGPLALFRHTLKYGRALADILPTLATTANWQLRAEIVLRDQRMSLDLDASAPLARSHALPRRTDSQAEKRLHRDLLGVGPPWTVRRESVAIKVGRQLFYPDFALVHARGTVLVELVGYWTDQYLEAKVRALAHVGQRLIVCVDAKNAQKVALHGPTLDSMLVYEKRVPAAALLARAERLLDARAGEAVGGDYA